MIVPGNISVSFVCSQKKSRYLQGEGFHVGDAGEGGWGCRKRMQDAEAGGGVEEEGQGGKRGVMCWIN